MTQSAKPQEFLKVSLILDGDTPTIVARNFQRANEGDEWQMVSEDVGLVLHAFGLKSGPGDSTYTRDITRLKPKHEGQHANTWYANIVVGPFFGTVQIQAKDRFENGGGDLGAYELLLAGDNLFPNADQPPADLTETTEEDGMQWMWRTSMPFKDGSVWKKPESAGSISQKRIPRGIYVPGDVFIGIKLDEEGSNSLVLVCVLPDGSLKQSLPIKPGMLTGKDSITLNLAKHGIESPIKLSMGELPPVVRGGSIPRYFMQLDYTKFSSKEGRGFLLRALSRAEMAESELQKSDPKRSSEVPRKRPAPAGAKERFIYRPTSRQESVKPFAVTYFESIEEFFCCRTTLRDHTIIGVRSNNALVEGECDFEVADTTELVSAEANPTTEGEGGEEVVVANKSDKKKGNKDKVTVPTT